MLEVEISQWCGYQKGLLVYMPFDTVHVVKSDGTRRHVGFVDRRPGATLRFVRVLDKDLREAIRKQVARLREEQGLPPISLLTVGPPDPRIVAAYLKGEKLRERPTTIIVPNEVPSGQRHAAKEGSATDRQSDD